MPNARIDGKPITSIPAKVEADMKKGQPKKLAMSHTKVKSTVRV